MYLYLLRSLRTGAGILLLALGLASVAAPAALAAQPARLVSHAVTAKHTQQLTVNITATGATVWGTVTIGYTYQGHTVKRTTSRALSTFSIPRGATVHLQEQPSSASNWPFKRWSIGQGAKASTTGSTAVSFKMSHNFQATALYVFQSSSGGYGGYFR